VCSFNVLCAKRTDIYLIQFNPLCQQLCSHSFQTNGPSTYLYRTYTGRWNSFHSGTDKSYRIPRQRDCLGRFSRPCPFTISEFGRFTGHCGCFQGRCIWLVSHTVVLPKSFLTYSILVQQASGLADMSSPEYLVSSDTNTVRSSLWSYQISISMLTGMLRRCVP